MRMTEVVEADGGLRELALVGQRSVPDGDCRLPCPEPVPGDRIAWTEAAGRERGGADDRSHGRGPDRRRNVLELRTVRASGPDAPEPGSSIARTAAAVTARGCFRAPWKDEARRERISALPSGNRNRPGSGPGISTGTRGSGCEGTSALSA